MKHRLPWKVTWAFKSILKNMPILKYGTYKSSDLNIRYRRATEDRMILREIFEKEIYCPEGFEIAPPDIVIDIGAQIGAFSVYAASKASKGKIISFEPFRSNYELCEYNVKNNDIKNINLLNMGIASDSSERTLLISYNTGGHSIVPASDKTKLTGKTVVVRCIDLDTIFSQYNIERCDFLKIDCEGGEYEIFESMKPQTWRKIHKIVLEYHEYPEKELTVDRLVDILKAHDFKSVVVPKRVKKEGFVFAKSI